MPPRRERSEGSEVAWGRMTGGAAVYLEVFNSPGGTEQVQWDPKRGVTARRSYRGKIEDGRVDIAGFFVELGGHQLAIYRCGDKLVLQCDELAFPFDASTEVELSGDDTRHLVVRHAQKAMIEIDYPKPALDPLGWPPAETVDFGIWLRWRLERLGERAFSSDIWVDGMASTEEEEVGE